MNALNTLSSHTETLAIAQPARHSIRTSNVLSAGIIAIASIIGILAFISPFFAPVQVSTAPSVANASNSPLVLALLVGLCLVALFVEVQGQAMSAKLIALLGVLVAINSALRFAENAIPGPGGFTPVFFLILLAGYVFGARFGFLMGALTMLVSAIVTAGVGPWLPYQMFTAGWMGMSAGWLGSWGARGRRNMGAYSHLRPSAPLLPHILFGAVWGFIYGAMMNLWSWPFQAGDPTQSWQAGLSAADGFRRYLVFYLATSLLWDLFAALGTTLMLILLGRPTLKALRRFKDRFLFEVGD